MATIAFLGNFGPSYSSESHHAKSLEALGHEVHRFQEREQAPDILADMFVWVHTHGWQTEGIGDYIQQCKDNNIPIVSYHLDLWFGLDRQKDLEDDPFYKMIDYWFVTDKLMADWLNKETQVKGYYLPAGVYGDEAKMLTANDSLDVVFVGSRGYHPEWPYRPQLIDWLKTTYGSRFGHYSGEMDSNGLKRGLELNQLYANTKVVVGDTLCIGFDYPYYFSDRLFETTGRGGFLIFPYIKGLERQFLPGKELVTYNFGDFEQLQSLIDYYLEHDEEREKIRKAGFERALKDHTYEKRWKYILDTVGLTHEKKLKPDLRNV